VSLGAQSFEAQIPGSYAHTAASCILLLLITLCANSSSATRPPASALNTEALLSACPNLPSILGGVIGFRRDLIVDLAQLEPVSR
jgi:hypothetical protein